MKPRPTIAELEAILNSPEPNTAVTINPDGSIDVVSPEAERWSETMRLKSENEHLRAVLRPFCTADWYATGHGTFEGKVEKAVLDDAKAALGMVPAAVGETTT